MTSTTTVRMPVADALLAGAPRTLGALAAAATGCGWGVMVERDATADAWTLVVATPSDSRTGRYTWRAGKWATASHGYRETVTWYRSGMESLPGAAVETVVEEVKVPVGDVSAETRAEAEAGVVAARAALDAVKAGQKAEEALAEARKCADAAGGFQHSAETAQEAAEAARTWAEADAEADQAEADAKGAAEAVVECKRAFQRAQRAANECRKYAEAATGALYETEADRAFDRAKDARETARESLDAAEEAAEAAKEAAEAARETADDECMRCGEWLCACREIMCAMLARYGSGAARTVDPEAVRIGELIMSDAEELHAAGQLMLCGEWAEAEEAIERAEEGPAEAEAEAEARRAAVRAAEAAVEPAAPVATCDGRTARQWAEEAEGHAYRAAEAYELTVTAVRHRTNIYDAMPVERLDETEGKRVRAALARVARRSRTAYDLEISARRDWWDGAEITDPARARDCAERARVLADGCESDARTVAEAFAWAEAEAAAAAELQRAEWSLADAEERYEAARRPNAWIGAQGVDRRIGETNALRLVWIARQALAAVNGAPFIAYPTLTDRGTVKGWSVGYCTVSRYAGTAVRIVDTSTDQDRAEMIAEAKNREHAARVLCERMAGELGIMRALMDDARHMDTKVPGARYRQARTALETAEELHDRAARERGTEAADRIAPVADKVRALGATVAEYARDREEWARNQRAAEAARAEAAPVSAPTEAAVEEAPRYRFGRRDAEGRYPVSVDGAPVGHVYRTRRTWCALGLDETRRTDHTSRAEAAARLVGLVDVRAAAEADTARRLRACTVAPEGWRVATWDAVGPGDVVRTPGRCVPVRGGFGDGGPLSPETWGAPVTLTGVERLDNGCVVARGREGDAPGWAGMGVLLSTPAYAEIGLLVPVADVPAAVETAAETAVEEVPAAARPGAAGSVGAPLSRLPRGGRGRGVRAGHSTRQGTARQGARQGTRQAPGRAGRPLQAYGERGPPPVSGRWAGCRRFPENLTRTLQKRQKGRGSARGFVRELDRDAPR
ncbi:hypothetical protein [Streptomyces candidus]|uniref:Uncharacterized protein n=1 Tax=Streptomyces candidus TaxID=67283 RepID=A0A7X0HLQ0_9ACTN|nr:hypothetical protein [Streptomyces candidus]MBB6439974.1 hypothetical protein [Streptomyces candidus]GHH56048.1 hypothetical protein GCM10018773_61310 [Streptomyces candidus]